MYALVGHAYDLELEVGAYFLLEGIGNLALAVPATAAGIGSFDYLTLLAARDIDVREDTATAYVLTMHALTVLPVTILGRAARPPRPSPLLPRPARRRSGRAGRLDRSALAGAPVLPRQELELSGLEVDRAARRASASRPPPARGPLELRSDVPSLGPRLLEGGVEHCPVGPRRPRPAPPPRPGRPSGARRASDDRERSPPPARSGGRNGSPKETKACVRPRTRPS